MVSLGMVRSAINWFSFTWDGNVLKIWNMPGPEPSFTAMYHFDYWLKNVLSLVVLFRNFTTHLHLIFYAMMLYPLLTGERPRLMVPWLHLQMLKNIVTDVISTVVGVLLCWTLHSCGLMLLEFLVVRIISMMPSIYLWGRLRSYYFDLYYAELDADYSFPMVKGDHAMTLAQRRRATKSLDGAIVPVLTSPDSRSRINSCLTYEAIFGPPNWEEDSENKTSKSLTTLLTMESEGSDDVEEDSRLKIIDDENLTPAEKTLRILGLTREEVDAANLQLHKRTSTTDVRDHQPMDVDLKSSLLSVTGETVGPRTVGMQVRLAERSKASSSSEEQRTQHPKKCACCEETKCSKEVETDSDEKEDEAGRKAEEDTLSGGKSLNCCDKSRKGSVRRHGIQNSCKERDDDNTRDAEAQVTILKSGKGSGTVSVPSRYQENHFRSGPRLQSVVQRDGIAWGNLREINFVSVINKALCNEIKPFKSQRDCADSQKPILKNLFEGSHAKLVRSSDQNSNEIIPEREDGTKFISRPQASWDFDSAVFSVPTSASFGVDSGILALNASHVFEETSISGNHSFDSTARIRPENHIGVDSYFKSSFQRHSNMFDDTRAQLQPLGTFQSKVDSPSYRVVEKIEEKKPQYRWDNYDSWDFDTGILSGNKTNAVRDIPESRNSRDAVFEAQSKPLLDSEVTPKNQRIISGDKILLTVGKNGSKDRRSLASSSRSLRSSKTRETLQEREAKTILALKAYNEKTLLKYKREMDALSRDEKDRSEFRYPFSKQNHATSFVQDLYAPSAPELGTPEEELILNIENAYARFTRSKPTNTGNFEVLPGNTSTKEFFDIYSGVGREKKDSQNKVSDEKRGMRKQHSKYRESLGGEKRNESGVTSMSCKIIDLSQKGRELERIVAMENVRVLQNLQQVYFLEQQIDERPSTSKTPPITTIKSFPRQSNGAGVPGTVSSEVLTTMIQVLKNPEEIPCRIEDSEYYRRLRKNGSPKNVRGAVKNIDWSFQRPTRPENYPKKFCNTRTEVVAAETSSERRDIMEKTTETMLEIAFANSKDSERGFRLGESENEFYPIFDAFAVAMEEIVRTAGLRGYTDEFISQPATEVEIPEIEEGDVYGLTDLRCELIRRKSSSGGFLRRILTKDILFKKLSKNEEPTPVTPSAGPGIQEKKLEAAVMRDKDSLDQDETISIHADEEAPSLLSKLISAREPASASAEINLPIIGPEDVPEEPENASGDIQSPKIRDLEYYSSSTSRSQKNGFKMERLVTQNSVYQSPGQARGSHFKIDVATCRSILARFDTGGKETIMKAFDQFDSSTEISFSNGTLPKDFRGSGFIAVLQILTNLQKITATAGEIIGAEEERPSRGSGNSSIEQNEQSGSRSTSGTLGTADFESVNANTSTGNHDPGFGRRKGDQDKEGNNLGRRAVVDVESNPDSGTSSSQEIGKPCSDEKKLLSDISDVDSVSPTHSEFLRREDFRRKVISSAFVQAINQSSNANKAIQVQDESFTVNLEEPEDEIPELWVTDDEQQTPRTAMDDTIFLEDVANNASPDKVLREIEIANHAIKRMKTVFEQFSKEQEEKREESLKLNSKVSSLTNLIVRFPVDEELQKLQNLVQTVANYTMIVGSDSAQSVNSERRQTSSVIGTAPETLHENEVKSILDDSRAGEGSVPKSRSVLKNDQGPVGSRHNVDRFSSWDKIIPLSTRRQIAKNRRKSKPTKVMIDREPPRRVVKVIKLTEKKKSDFFSARSIPQRGRGRSSGYLMDSDSDGNFTISRPLTPVSVESTTSQNLSWTREEPEVSPSPLEDSKIFPKSVQAANPPIEPCLGSSPRNPIREKKIDDQCTQNTLRDEEMDVLGTGSLSTGNYLENMKLVDAAGIENKLKDVVQLILSHQFREPGPLTNEPEIVSKDASLTTVSVGTRTASSIHLQSNSGNPEEDVEKEEKIEQECKKRIRETLSKAENVPDEQLVAHCRAFDSTSGNSDAVSVDIAERTSGGSLKDVAVGTEYNTEVFKELLDVFAKIRSQEEKMIPEKNNEEKELVINSKRTSDSSRSDFTPDQSSSAIGEPSNLESFNNEEPKERVEAPNRLNMSSSYDSFTSLFSQDATELSERSCQAISISNHTHFEDFPEQVDSSSQYPETSCEAADAASSESIRIEHNLQEEYHEKNSSKESRLASLAAVTPGSSSVDAKSERNPSPKKRGIPRLIKGSKDHR